MGRRPRRRSSVTVTCRSAGPERGPSPNGRDSCPLIIRSSWPMPRGSRRVCEKPDCRSDRQGGARPSRGKNSSSTCARGREAANRRPIVRSDPRLGTRSGIRPEPGNAKRFRPRKNRLPAIAGESPVRIREAAGQGCDIQQENRVSTPQSPSTAERAYLIWEQMGRPEGQALEHWLRAEVELTAEPAASMPRSDRAARMPRRARRKKA